MIFQTPRHQIVNSEVLHLIHRTIKSVLFDDSEELFDDSEEVPLNFNTEATLFCALHNQKLKSSLTTNDFVVEGCDLIYMMYFFVFKHHHLQTKIFHYSFIFCITQL